MFGGNSLALVVSLRFLFGVYPINLLHSGLCIYSCASRTEHPAAA